ncbi:SnoaL-like polyketide cyclase [Saccharomonospora viridis DSM 43017]|uniref:SnoaL-like polyketide cyclase n=1 Tax=Saccharomonospora viridis (strain ATCC 15386 / DSM 43017 / JCM 3036 / CCUG 5913 / NBRC 12207 / NCIMB 9602 / P101) TaxID=471857 RepID=C7MRU8_SACVD|nr:SnoaL-like polyketide cyclase [Saccharomonospora viridis DSM 43017]
MPNSKPTRVLSEHRESQRDTVTDTATDTATDGVSRPVSRHCQSTLSIDAGATLVDAVTAAVTTVPGESCSQAGRRPARKARPPARPRVPHEDGTMDERTATTLYRRWLDELWNGEDDRLDEVAATLVTADFVGHWPKHPGLARGPAQLADIVRQGRRLVDDCVFELVLGPVPHDDLVAARWRGRGRHQGDPVTFHGHDLLRVDGDRFAEYWVIAEDPTD